MSRTLQNLGQGRGTVFTVNTKLFLNNEHSKITNPILLECATNLKSYRTSHTVILTPVLRSTRRSSNSSLGHSG